MKALYYILREYLLTRKVWFNEYDKLSIDSRSSDKLIIIRTKDFTYWKKLKKKGYSDEKLQYYFIELIRDEIPELIGNDIEFDGDKPLRI